MSAITDALDAKWQEKSQDEDMFAIRAIIEDFYNNLVQAIQRGSDLYPTGNTTFDNYVQPIVAEMTTFKNTLDTNYSDFIGWRQS